jgi:hypothetical protein
MTGGGVTVGVTGLGNVIAAVHVHVNHTGAVI